MGPARRGGKPAEARAHCGDGTHIQPEHCFCERIRDSVLARVTVDTEIFSRPAASITLLASTLPAPLSSSRIKLIARRSCEGGTGTARRRSAMSQAARAGSQVAQWTTLSRARQNVIPSQRQHGLRSFTAVF